MEPQKNKKRGTQSSTSLARYTDIVFRMGGTIALGMWFGKWLDGKMNVSKPIYLPIFAILAIGLAIYLVIRDADKPNK